jgi:hypothetical protein
MSHEKRPLAELMQENEEKESLKKGKPTQVATSADRTVTQSDLPPSRQGKSRLETWVSRDAKKQLRLLAVEEEKSQDQLLRDGLNMLFRSHGIPPIA